MSTTHLRDKSVITLACGHERTGARCGLCDKCWDGCCTCNRDPVSFGALFNQVKAVAEIPRPATPRDNAVVLGSIPAVGKTRVRVLCTCGQENLFYLWSWSGHGKAKCVGCESFIDRHTLKVSPPKG